MEISAAPWALEARERTLLSLSLSLSLSLLSDNYNKTHDLDKIA